MTSLNTGYNPYINLHPSVSCNKTNLQRDGSKTHQKSIHECKRTQMHNSGKVNKTASPCQHVAHPWFQQQQQQAMWLHSRNCGYISCCKHPAKQLRKQFHSVSGINIKVLHNQSPVHTLATLSLYTLSTLSYRLLLLFVPFKNLLQNCQCKGKPQHLQRR